MNYQIADKAGKPRKSFPDFLKHHFVRLYGLKSIALKNLANLAAGVRMVNVIPSPPQPNTVFFPASAPSRAYVLTLHLNTCFECTCGRKNKQTSHDANDDVRTIGTKARCAVAGFRGDFRDSET